MGYRSPVLPTFGGRPAQSAQLQVNVQDSFHQSVLHYAAWKGHVSVAELFIGKMKKVHWAGN